MLIRRSFCVPALLPALVVTSVTMGACDSGSAAAETDADTEVGSSGPTTSGGVTSDATSAGSVGSDDASASASSSGGTTEAEVTTGDSNSETGAPDGDGCCDVHAGEGCDEADVELCVCEGLPQCCLFAWEQECVELAQTRCEATCEGDGTSSSSSGGETTSDTATGTCEEPVVLELGVGDATLTGDWTPSVSEVGEGDIAVLMGGGDGAVTWDVDVPCDDTWFIWVRYWEQGSDDSYFVAVDGEPKPPAVFEGDCTNGGQGYGWRLLNERGDAPCVYIQDPWAPQWEAGSHTVAFSYRESIALARIVVTNDPKYAP